MNKDSWNKLSPEQQQIVRAAGRKAQEQNVKSVNDARKAYIERTTAAGIKHYTLPEEERNKLIAMTPPIYENAKKVISPLGVKLLQKLESLKGK